MNTQTNDSKRATDKKFAGKTSPEKNAAKDAGKAVKKSPAKK
jgi:hypothetical protein